MKSRQSRSLLPVIGGIFGGAVVAGLLAGLLVLGLIGPAGLAVRDASQTFDDLKVPALAQLPSRSEILDARGHLIAYYYPNHIYRVPVAYDQIAPVMRFAIVAIEDSRFYHHGALDIRGSLRAIVTDLGSGQVQGGSTIAQQYVKNALVLTATSPAQLRAAVADDLARKIRELRIAADVAHEMSLNQLLTAYLNVAYFENEAYGVQVAAERYFGITAAKLTLTQAAMLAGLVQNPSAYDPLSDPAAALARRNLVVARMAQLGYVSQATATSAEKAPLGLHYSSASLGQGCSTAGKAAWFCDYVLAELQTNPAYGPAWQRLNTTGGLRIYSTMDSQDQLAAQNAVSYMVPPPPSSWNPGGNAAAEVLITPGTGWVRAIAVDRIYGTGKTQDSIDYAADTAQNGGIGVQTGSSSKLFTLIAALKERFPFGFSLPTSSPAVFTGYSDCEGRPTGPFRVINAEGKGKGTYTLYTGTTRSINVFYAQLERRVGLCRVVRTAVSMGLHRADGSSLTQGVGKPGSAGYQLPADELPSFTLGSVNVSPMSMAAAYASVAGYGIYCQPIAIRAIITAGGASLPVQSAGCHRVMSAAVAEAATYILRGVLTRGTATGDGVIRGGVYIAQAGKTGTASSFDFAAFGGYTPRLAGYVSMFNPVGPVTHPMIGTASCYRSAFGGADCPGSIFGANAGQIWQMTFESADLGGSLAYFTPPSPGSVFFREGSGMQAPAPHPHRH